jgi:hypothetical protein
MSEETRKCQFCELEATTIYRVMVAVAPFDEPTGYLHYEYFGEAVYTCDNHTLSCQGFLLNGKDGDVEER